jgi:hypothetical protein
MDARVRDAEHVEKDRAEYWLGRAEYFAGRKHVKEATEAYEKAWALALLDPVAHFKDPRLYKSHVLAAYTRFWMQTHDAASAYELMWKKLKEVPLEGECARNVVYGIWNLEQFDAPRDDKQQKPRLFRSDDERLWAFFAAQKKWGPVERVMMQMIDNTAPEQREAIWKRGEALARGASPSRAYTLGWLMTRNDDAAMTRRAIPLLKDAMARYPAGEDREKAAFELFEAALTIGDWQLAKQTWPAANRDVGDEDALGRLGHLAVAMANAKAADEAMKQWAAIANVDRWELRCLDEMVRAGLRDRLIAFYEQMSRDDPASEVPAETLRKLKRKGV